jgi:hypothetical protein
VLGSRRTTEPEVDEDGSVGVDQLAVEVDVGGDVHGFGVRIFLR